MARARTVIAACFVSALGMTAFVECSTSQAGPADASLGGCVPYVADADLSTPTISFVGAVTPIFQTSCAITGAACHGDPSVVSDKVSPRPFLGYSGGDAAQGDAGAGAAAEVFAGLVGVKSREDPSMDLVAPGDPAHSFLMHKIDGDQCTLMAQCAVSGSSRPNCGAFMPYQYPAVLDVPTRDTVRRWIAQGAGDN